MTLKLVEAPEFDKRNGALIEGRCRFWLRRVVPYTAEQLGLVDLTEAGPLPRVAISRRALLIMHNPSTADATHNDPTMRAVLDFARGWRCCEVTVVNVNPVRCTNPALLDAPTEAEAIANAGIIAGALDEKPDLIVCAWGAIKRKWFGHVAGVLEVVRKHAREGQPLGCLGVTKDGHPRHPLFVERTKISDPEPYEPGHFYQLDPKIEELRRLGRR